MQNRVTVALDAMGGDFAPEAVIAGALLYLKKNQISNVFFRIFGDSGVIKKLLNAPESAILVEKSEIFHTEDLVMPDEKPSVAIRKKKDSSMYRAVQDVKEKNSDCVISAGNTGAFMAISKVLIGMLQNIHRPAIITTMPTRTGELVVLDLGANLDCNSDILFQFAFMGVAFCRAVLGKENPSVALLNIGIEENKGTDTLKETFHLLKNKEDRINFCGFIEPSKILDGDVDIVVTDGFSGNIMLKTAESMACLIKESIITATKKSIFGIIISFLLGRVLRSAMARFNPKVRNGAMLIGLNGVAVKAHGSSDAASFSNAIEIATNLVSNSVNSQIIENIYSLE